MICNQVGPARSFHSSRRSRIITHNRSVLDTWALSRLLSIIIPLEIVLSHAANVTYDYMQLLMEGLRKATMWIRSLLVTRSHHNYSSKLRSHLCSTSREQCFIVLNHRFMKFDLPFLQLRLHDDESLYRLQHVQLNCMALAMKYQPIMWGSWRKLWSILGTYFADIWLATE